MKLSMVDIMILLDCVSGSLNISGSNIFKYKYDARKRVMDSLYNQLNDLELIVQPKGEDDEMPDAS